jgi:glycosyltransferase involved in cell wall biosynthesis
VKLLFAIKRLENAAGGSERVLAKVCSELASRGHEIVVLTWDAAGAQPFYPFDQRVRFLNLGIGDSARRTRPWEFIRRLWILRRAVNAVAPHVAVGFGHSMFVPLAFALVGTRTPRIGSEHAATAHYDDKPLQLLLLRLAAPLLDSVTVLSEMLRDDYPADLRSRMIVLPNPVLAAPQAEACHADTRYRTILNVGRLDPQKDQATLIKAFALVAPDFPDWRLRIIGEGGLRQELELLVQQLDLNGRVTLPGVTQMINKEYASAHLFALPSRYESFGLVSTEAMSHGLAVLGFNDCPGTNEVVLDGATGLLVGPEHGRVTSFADGLRKLMADADLRHQLGRAGRDRIAHLSSQCDVVERWEALLTSASTTKEISSRAL